MWKIRQGKYGKLLAVFLAGGFFASLAAAQSAVQGGPSNSAAVNKASTPVRYVPNISRRAQMYYQGIWGVDELKVKYTESGEMIRFSYRVLDPAKAAVLNDKKTEPSLIDPQAGVKLVIPEMQNVGKLRQSSKPDVGKSYWMAFSNKGRLVKRGHRVDVVIGNFRATGLSVD
jgi:hypothetical protein